MARAKYNATEKAKELKAMADKLGWKVYVRGSVLTITKRITAGDNDSFVAADMEYWSILEILPTTSAGSTWGTDGGGIGALSAMKSGTFTMNKSGGAKRVLTALTKLI